MQARPSGADKVVGGPDPCWGRKRIVTRSPNVLLGSGNDIVRITPRGEFRRLVEQNTGGLGPHECSFSGI